jgi:malyl-CoA/(S)-citramalyl-CoA lyase
VTLKSPKSFFAPLAVGAPAPLREIPARPSRAIHFFDPSNPKMVDKIPQMVGSVDVLLGNLEDAVKADNKIAARQGLVTIAKGTDFGPTQLWTRINSLDSPWALDDLTTLVTEIGDKLDVVMVPKVQGAEDIHYVDRLLAQLEAKAGITRPILVHAILETARGVAEVENIALASPRMQGISLGPADLAADRKMKTTRVGGGHPGYLVRQDPASSAIEDITSTSRTVFQQDLWHYTIAKMVDACATAGIYPYYGPFGDITDVVATEDQFRNAFLLGCVGTWSLHPKQIEIANRVFSPSVEDIKHARRVVAAMGDGTGAVMLDGKMEDDASLKQCLVMVALAEELAAIDPKLKELYDTIEIDGENKGDNA